MYSATASFESFFVGVTFGVFGTKPALSLESPSVRALFVVLSASAALSFESSLARAPLDVFDWFGDP